MTFSRAWFIDATERVVRAFLIAFIGQWVANAADIYNVTALKAAATAGIVAGLSVVLSLLGAANGGGGVSPASLAPTTHIVPRRGRAKTRRRRADHGVTAVGVVLAVVIVIIAFSLFGTLHSPLFLLLLLAVLLVVLL